MLVRNEIEIAVGVSVMAVCAAGAYFFWRGNYSQPSNSTVSITAQQAVEIYKLKLEFMSSIASGSEPKRSKDARIKREHALVGARYHISAKSVSDIWNRKTWVVATSHLWSAE
jgi:hypothetical protein